MDDPRELIIDHAANGRHWGVLPNPQIDQHAHNPLCGDTIHVTLAVVDGQVSQVGWAGQGCALSQGTASLLGEHILGKDLAAISALTAADIFALIGMQPMMNRAKCALLALQAVQNGIRAYKVP
ncbi:MAG: iron-sulfur cluster assembly scaffold protein [Armatimonadetes bacterium]|nr:iron-sulfur cluster assembly scaffold protein [Anaerolineae bacterium]